MLITVIFLWSWFLSLGTLWWISIHIMICKWEFWVFHLLMAIFSIFGLFCCTSFVNFEKFKGLPNDKETLDLHTLSFYYYLLTTIKNFNLTISAAMDRKKKANTGFVHITWVICLRAAHCSSTGLFFPFFFRIILLIVFNYFCL